MRKTLLRLYSILFLLLLSSPNLFGQARFWVGGTGGNWGDPSKWSTVSGGVGGAGAPTASQDALFDVNSFTAPGSVVVVTGGATCRRMNWSGVINTPVLSLTNALTIAGNNNAFVLDNNMSVTGSADLLFTHINNLTLTLGTVGKTLGPLVFTGSDPRTITLNTGDGTHTHSLGPISLGNNVNFIVSGNSSKVYGGLTSGSNVECTFRGNSEFTGDVLIDGSVDFLTGANLILGGTVPISVTFRGTANNTFQTVTASDNSLVTFSNAGTNAFGSILVNSGVQWKFSTGGTSTISGNFTVNAVPCGAAYAALNSNTGTTQATVLFGGFPNRDHVNISNLNNTGPTINVLSGSGSNNIRITFPSPAGRRTLYWVGGTGNWSNPSQWSTASGGASRTCPPAAGDDVVFDANSFTAPGQTATVDVNATCNNMTWVTATNAPTFALNNLLTVNGTSFSLANAMATIGGSTITFTNPGNLALSLGTAPKALGNLVFNPTATVRTIAIDGTDGGPHSLGTLTAGNATLTLTGTAAKTVNGLFLNNVTGSFAGSNTFTGAVSINGGMSLHNATFASAAVSTLDGSYTFTGTTAFTGTGSVTFTGPGNNTFGDVTAGPVAVSLSFANGGNNSFNQFTLHNNGAGAAVVAFTNAGTSSYQGIAISNGGTGSSTWRFTAAGMSSVTGNLTVGSSGCLGVTISSAGGAAATVQLVSAQNVSGAAVANVRITGAGFTVTNGQDNGGNTGIQFANSPRTLYWRSNDGNWSDPSKWAIWNGVSFVPAGCPPSSTDDVVFDNASFTQSFRRITVNGNARCRNMNWIGIIPAQSPVFECPAANTLTLTGSLELSPSTVTSSFLGKVIFASTATGRTLRTAGRPLAAIDFNGPGGSWQLLDGLTASGTLSLIAGTLDANGQVITANTLTANDASNLPRTIRLGNATHVLRGIGTALDLRGNDGNFLLDAGTSTILFTGNAGATGLTVETGTFAKILPHLSFIGAGTYSLNTTGTTTNRITFGDLVFSNINQKTIAINGNNPKTYGNLQINGNRSTVTINGASTALPGGNVFGAVTFGDSFTATRVTFNGNNVFNGPVNFHANSGSADLVLFTGSNVFNGTCTVRLASTAGTELQFASSGANTTAFYDAVSINPGNTNSDAWFNNATTFHPGADLTIGGASSVEFRGTGNNTFADVFVNGGVSSTSIILGNSGSSTFRNVTLDATTTPTYPSSGIIWKFKSGSTVTSVFAGMMHIKAVCQAPVVVESDAGPGQARVAFNSPQIWNNNVLARNLNAVNAAGSITVFQQPVNSTNVVYSGSTANRTLYWVGGTGSWGNPFRWSTSSGGNGGACIPTANDDVFFDANSGLGVGRIVAITAGPALCRGMNWTGIPAATATVLDLGNNSVEVNGSLTLAQGLSVQPVATTANGAAFVFTNSSTGNAATTAVTNRSIHTPNGTTALLPNVLFNALGVTWSLNGPAPFGVSYQLGLQAGTVRVNATTVTCNHLTANMPGNLGRTLDIGNGHLVINGDITTGQYNVLDLRGSNLNFVTPGPNAKVQFTNAAQLAVQTGDIAKELPDLLFESIPASSTAGPADIDIYTSNTTSRITFRGIRITRATGTEMYVKGSCPKTYKGALIFPDGFNRNAPGERAFNGTDNPAPNNNIFAGPVTFGNNCGVAFYNNNTFSGTVTFGTETGSTGGVVFRDHNTFGGKVTIAGTKDTNNAVQFSGTNLFLSGAELMITANTGLPPRNAPTVQFNNLGGFSTFNDHVTLQGPRAIYRFNGSAYFNGTNKKATIGEQTRAWFIGGGATSGSGEPVPGPGEYRFNGVLQLSDQSLARFRNDASNGYNHVVMDEYTILELTALPARISTIQGDFSVVGSCAVWTQVTSSFGGAAATVAFVKNQTWQGTIVQDINNTGPGTVTVSSGIDQGNNANFLFTGTNLATGTLVWVGGNPLNLSTNNHWTNPRNWARPPLDDAKRANGGSCIPGSETDVLFNEESFSLTGTGTKPATQLRTVFVNLVEASCGSMTWADNVNQQTGAILPGLLGGVPDNQIEVNGALVFAPPNRMFNDFDGTFKFNLNSAPYFRPLDANGGNGPADPVTRFAGPVEFANVSATWRLESDLLINANSSQGDFIITYGTVQANGRTITLDGDWLIKSPLGGNPQGKFEAGTAGKVLFNGGNTGRAQTIVAATSPFWDVEINRGEAGNPTNITNDNATPDGYNPVNRNSFVITLNKNEMFPLEATAGATTRLNAATNGVTIKHSLTITRGHLWDYGYQLVGNTDGGGMLTIRDEGVLSIGNANGGNGSGPNNNSPLTTSYPAGYAVAGNNSLARNSTVSYAANGHQDISAVPAYGNLYFRNANCVDAGLSAIGGLCQRKRIALGPLQLNGDLTIEGGIHLIDNGFQIRGNALGTSRFTMGRGAILTLGSGNTIIATTTGAGANPASNTTGSTTVVAAASTFPQYIALANLNLDPNSVIIYHASVSQPVKGLSSAVADQQYGHLVVQNATPGAVAAKLLDGPVQVRGSLVINPGGALLDNGHQISYTGLSGQIFRMASGVTSTSVARVQDLSQQQANAFLTINNVSSGLVLGSQTRATAFPNYADAELDLDQNTTITYHAGVAQSIRGLNDPGGTVAGQRQYANLELTNPVNASPALVPKTLTGPVVIRGSLSIYPNNNLADGGNGIAGTSGQPFAMYNLSLAPHPVTGSGYTGTVGSSRLTLGTATAATSFPTGYRTGNGTPGSPSDIRFEPGTTVVYASGRPQNIRGLGGTGNTTYANLILANPAATPAAAGLPTLVFPVIKTLLSESTTIRGALTIYPNNTLFDNGLQINGTAGGQFRMYSVTTTDPETGSSVGGSSGQSRLVLGNSSAATHFPTGFQTGDGSAADPSDIYFESNTAVVYNAGVNQPVQVLGNGTNTAYADLLLSNPVSAGVVLINKVLQATAGSGVTSTKVRGTFTIGPNVHCIDNGYQLNGVAGRVFSMLNTTLAANPTRTFTTDPTTAGTAGPSQLTLGSATKGTAFPTGYQTLNGTDINLEPNTTVVYNAGVDQPVQALITTGSLTANANYAHVVLANPAGSGFPVKNLTNDTRIRGNLVIQANNDLDAGVGNSTLFLQGDWTGNGRFTARAGTVVMEGNETQIVIHSNTAIHEHSATPETGQDFYNWIINKPAGEVVLQSRLALSGTTTFTRGLIHAGKLSGSTLMVSPVNVLIFRDNATAIGASNRSFVTGAVRKTGNDAFVFPVGAAGVIPPAYAAPTVPEPNLYRPVGMSAPAGTAAFIAQYYYANPGAVGFDPARKQTESLNQSQPLLSVSTMEYWMLNREASVGAADVFVRLSWHDPQSGGVGKATATIPATSLDYQWLRVARWNGTAWHNMGGTGFGPDPIGGAAASNIGGTVASEYNVSGTVGPVNQFSPFTLSSLIPNNPLPVTLVHFNGRWADNYVLLNWQTTTEVNTSHFVVERSQDGVHFVPVATVKAKGKAEAVQVYQARDTNSLGGVSYYRLQIVDADGRFEYSRIINISAHPSEAAVTVLYPNPTEGRQVFVECTNPVDHPVAVYDLVGRKVFSHQTNLGEGKWKVTFGCGLQPGLYLMVVAGKAGTPPQRIRFVVR